MDAANGQCVIFEGKGGTFGFGLLVVGGIDADEASVIESQEEEVMRAIAEVEKAVGSPPRAISALMTSGEALRCTQRKRKVSPSF